MTNLKVRLGHFSGKDKEDPDYHVPRFEIRWHASGFDNLSRPTEKQQQFEATFTRQAMAWFSNFGPSHLAN